HRGRRAAGNHRLQLPTFRRTTAVLEDQFLEIDAHRELVHAGSLHVAGDAVELRPRVLRDAEAFEPFRPVLDDQRHARERLHVLDDRRPAKRADHRGERRLDARLAAMTLDRLDESRLLAADVRAGTSSDGDIEVESTAKDVLAEVAALARFGESFLKDRRAVVELAADVDV